MMKFNVKKVDFSFLYYVLDRFCRDAFDANYKSTIGVDFEVERFQILGLPFNLQM